MAVEIWKFVEKINPDLERNIIEFLVGNEEYLIKKCASIKIQKWYLKFPRVINQIEDIDTKSYYVRILNIHYDDDFLYHYPNFARDKMRLYSSKIIERFEETSSRLKVIKWIIKNLDINDMALVGI